VRAELIRAGGAARASGACAPRVRRPTGNRQLKKACFLRALRDSGFLLLVAPDLALTAICLCPSGHQPELFGEIELAPGASNRELRLALVVLVLHRTDDAHRRVVYGSRRSRLHLNLFIKHGERVSLWGAFGHPTSIILGDMSCAVWG
jgi:hypothetical protein